LLRYDWDGSSLQPDWASKSGEGRIELYSHDRDIEIEEPALSGRSNLRSGALKRKVSGDMSACSEDSGAFFDSPAESLNLAGDASYSAELAQLTAQLERAFGRESETRP